MNLRMLISMACLLSLTAGCTLGPEYRTPAAPLPSEFTVEGPWKIATPGDDIPVGPWWESFDDPALNTLEEQAMEANPGLQVALARVAQARAGLRFSQADRVPRADFNGSATRSRTAGDFSYTPGGQTTTFIDLPLDLGYELDLWGRVRRSVEAAGAEVQASEGDYRTARLALQAEVARTWFGLRTLDTEALLLEKTLELRRENLRLVRSLFNAGQIGKLDLKRAETELATAQADIAAVQRNRAALVHALAALTGEPASTLQIPASPLEGDAPAVIVGLPSTLLERRPDIAAAERRMAAANARIGVAQAAFFPLVRLFGSGGFQSASVGEMFSWDNRTWALGPSLSLPVFDGGRNEANLSRARALWNETAANYRQQVLTAVREVEDGLSGLWHLDQQANSLLSAVQTAREAAELSRKRYRAGRVSYLEVVDAERTVLQTERQAARVLGQQMETTVFLVKALGGGWTAADLEGPLAQRF